MNSIVRFEPPPPPPPQKKNPKWMYRIDSCDLENIIAIFEFRIECTLEYSPIPTLEHRYDPLIDWNHESKSICGNKDNEKSGTKGGEHENTYAIGVFKRIQERLGDDDKARAE